MLCLNQDWVRSSRPWAWVSEHPKYCMWMTASSWWYAYLDMLGVNWAENMCHPNVANFVNKSHQKFFDGLMTCWLSWSLVYQVHVNANVMLIMRNCRIFLLSGWRSLSHVDTRLLWWDKIASLLKGRKNTKIQELVTLKLWKSKLAVYVKFSG